MRVIQKHSVVVKKEDGSFETFPMKQWLRHHPNVLPGMDPNNTTSHELRRALQSKGWRMEQTADQVLLMAPDLGSSAHLVEDLLEGESTSGSEEIEQAHEITFGLERDLQAALRAHIEQLEPGLIIIDGGKERTTNAGRIDITAKDAAGNVVIVELKAGEAQPEAVAQVLAYMGAVSDADKVSVRGILVAGSFHDRVVLASRAVGNLQLRKYSFQFTFASIP